MTGPRATHVMSTYFILTPKRFPTLSSELRMARTINWTKFNLKLACVYFFPNDQHSLPQNQGIERLTVCMYRSYA